MMKIGQYILVAVVFVALLITSTLQIKNSPNSQKNDKTRTTKYERQLELHKNEEITNEKPDSQKPTLNEILNKSRGYRASGGASDIDVLWHADSYEELMMWAEKMLAFPRGELKLNGDIRVQVLAATEGSGVITQTTYYLYLKTLDGWELRNISAIPGNAIVKFSSENDYTVLAKTVTGKLLFAISLSVPDTEDLRPEPSWEHIESLRKEVENEMKESKKSQ